MKDWIKAYWQYRLKKAELEQTIVHKVDWFSLVFWLFMATYIILDIVKQNWS